MKTRWGRWFDRGTLVSDLEQFVRDSKVNLGIVLTFGILVLVSFVLLAALDGVLFFVFGVPVG